MARLLLACIALAALHGAATQALDLRVRDASGTPMAGVMVTLKRAQGERVDTSDDGYPAPGTPATAAAEITRFSDASGTIRIEAAPESGFSLRARKPGYRDTLLPDIPPGPLPDLVMTPERDPVALAAASAANLWLARLDFDGDTVAHEHFLRHCTGCHQGASSFIRIERSPEQWRDVLDRMNRYGAKLADSQRKPMAEYLRRRFAELREHPEASAQTPAMDADLAGVTINEWAVGDSASQLHDVLLHPNGLVYTGDNLMDRIYEIDPLDGRYTVYRIPHSADATPGGVLGNRLAGAVPKVDNLYGAHSLALSPTDGHIFITPPNQQALIEFDPLKKQFMEWRLQEGFYPQTIRFDAKDRAWFTLGLSSKVAVFDRQARTFRYIDLPARGKLDQLLLWYTQWSLESGRGGEPPRYDLQSSGFPSPYGLDVCPDGTVWVARLNADDIARIDPVTLAVEIIPTPFAAPRRLRCDAGGDLWITGFAGGLVARYVVAEKRFRSYALPIPGETPYGLDIDNARGLVWVTGSQSDSLLSLDVATGRWRVFPLSRRGSFTRDIGVADDGSVFSSSSTFPGWQIEDGQPTLIRLAPGAAQAARE